MSEMPRLELLDALKFVRPALASGNNLLEALSLFWFDGKSVSAFDGVFGIRLAFETEFKGGVLGDKLIRLLEKSRAKTVMFTEDEDKNLKLRAGSTRAVFSLRPIDEFVWDPIVPSDGGFRITDEIVDGISSVLFSVGSGKVMTPEQRGVTIIQNDASVHFYSTDAITLSRCTITAADGRMLNGSDRIIAPTLFCEQVCRLAKGSEFYLLIDERAVYCRGRIKIGEQDAAILLYANLVGDDDPVPFDSVMDAYTNVKGKIAEPQRLRLALERAVVILTAGEAAEIEIDTTGRLRLYARSPFGEIADRFKVEGEHPPIKVKVDASLLRRGLGDDKGADTPERSMAIGRDCVVIWQPSSTAGEWHHVVATK